MRLVTHLYLTFPVIFSEVDINGSDSISGEAGEDSRKGNDIISGGLGNDTIASGEGSDQIYLTINQSVDLITDFQTGVDRLVLLDGLDNQLQFTSRDGDTVITYSDNQELAILQNVVISGKPILIIILHR